MRKVRSEHLFTAYQRGKKKRSVYIAVRKKCTALGYEVNNTKRESPVTQSERTESGHGVGEVGARQDFADGLITGRSII